jgi:hypothetical protein
VTEAIDSYNIAFRRTKTLCLYAQAQYLIGALGREMNEHEERALMYRRRSEELKVIASEMRDPISGQTLLKIASDYDRLAALHWHLADQESGTS